MTQEAFDTSPPVREACAASIFGHAETLEADLAAALANRDTRTVSNADSDSGADSNSGRDSRSGGVSGGDSSRDGDSGGNSDVSARAASLARHTQAVLQGGLVLSKAANDPAPVLEAIGHLRSYVGCVLDRTPPGESP